MLKILSPLMVLEEQVLRWAEKEIESKRATQL